MDASPRPSAPNSSVPQVYKRPTAVPAKACIWPRARVVTPLRPDTCKWRRNGASAYYKCKNCGICSAWAPGYRKGQLGAIVHSIQEGSLGR
eukprot:scaffold176148_cov19-Tisochrysis_lutea.AAC.1